MASVYPSLEVPRLPAGTEAMPSRRNLVMVRAGRRSRHPSYCADLAGQNFDLALSWWDLGEPADHGLASGARFVHDGRADSDGRSNAGVVGIARMLRECDALFDAYDYVCFANDDIVADGPTVSRMFDICHRLNLDVAHPAFIVASDSYNWDPISAVHKPFKVRFTNFVDWNFVVVSKHVRQRIFAPLSGAVSAHGIPHLWGQMVELGAMAIIDDTPVAHSRPVSRRGVTPYGAPLSGRNLARYSYVGRTFMLSYGGFRQDGSFLSMGPPSDSQAVLELLDTAAPDLLRSLHQLPADVAQRRLGKYLAGNRDFVSSSGVHSYVGEILRERLYHLGIAEPLLLG
jgi:hypothetical protein